MRKDKNIMKEIEKWREKERETACCIRNDDSGCIQASKEQCTVRYNYCISINLINLSIIPNIFYNNKSSKIEIIYSNYLFQFFYDRQFIIIYL